MEVIEAILKYNRERDESYDPILNAFSTTKEQSTMFWDYDKAKIRFYSIVLEIIKRLILVGTRHKNSPRQSKTVKDSPKSPW